MTVRANFSALGEARWSEYLIRFVLGGLATVLTGIVAMVWGPEIGGLFLAFPAIFAASTTLIEKHERKRKEKAGLKGERRGRRAAALDASGTALGSIGLLSFGAAVWSLSHYSPWGALFVAFAAWCVLSFLLWSVRRALRFRL
jgi:uncharacterized membrane protein